MTVSEFRTAWQLRFKIEMFAMVGTMAIVVVQSVKNCLAITGMEGKIFFGIEE